jgi:hypothetical protein
VGECGAAARVHRSQVLHVAGLLAGDHQPVALAELVIKAHVVEPGQALLGEAKAGGEAFNTHGLTNLDPHPIGAWGRQGGDQLIEGRWIQGRLVRVGWGQSNNRRRHCDRYSRKCSLDAELE